MLGSSHGRKVGPMLQEILSKEYEVTCLFKPNAPLANVEDLTKLGKDLTKRDHVTLVGGPGNGLDRNYKYSVEKDVNYIAQRSRHTNVKLVNLFMRHDKPWLNRRVKSINLGLDRALLGYDRSHIGVVDTSLLLRQDFTTHGLHLN